jgi:transcriptional regulator with XRE-family HTH domain
MSTRKDTLATDSPHVPKQDADMPLYLADWRKLRGLTGAELADRIGTQRSYVSKWETGERPLRDINWIKKICEVLEISPDDLSKMPAKSGEKVIVSKGVESHSVEAASVADRTEGVEMIEKRMKLHELLEEIPDDLLDTANSIINRLKGLGAGRPTKRAGTKP